MDGTVKLYDPTQPGHFRIELEGNFNPLIHDRWEARPSAQPANFPEAVAPALAKAGIRTAEDVAARAADLVDGKVKGVTKAQGELLVGWAHDPKGGNVPPDVDGDGEPDIDPAIAVLIDRQKAAVGGDSQDEAEASEGEAPAVGDSSQPAGEASGDSATVTADAGQGEAGA